MTARTLFNTGGSGGLGKSTGARWLAHALARTGYHVVLVDGNPGQQSQRAALHVPDRYSLEDVRLTGLRSALAPPSVTRAGYALLAGPADPNMTDAAADYLDAIIACTRMADFVIVDADRTDARQWNDHDSFSGGVMRPMVDQGAASILYRVGQTGTQTDDGLAALDAMRRPDATLAVGVSPEGARALPTRRWEHMVDGLARWGGCDTWDATSRAMAEQGARGWRAGDEPAWMLAALSFIGADMTRYTPAPTGKGGMPWFWTR